MTANIVKYRELPFLTRTSKSFDVPVVGCSAGEGDIVLERVSRSVSWTVDALRESLAPVARQLKAVLIVFKDYPKYYRRYLDRLRVCGFTRVPSMPASRMDLNFSGFSRTT